MSSATLPAVEGDAVLAETELAWLVERRLLLTGGRLTPIEDNLNGRRHGLRDLHADQKTLPALRWSPDAAFVRQREEVAGNTDSNVFLAPAGHRNARGDHLPLRSEEQFRSIVAPPRRPSTVCRDAYAPAGLGKGGHVSLRGATFIGPERDPLVVRGDICLPLRERRFEERHGRFVAPRREQKERWRQYAGG